MNDDFNVTVLGLRIAVVLIILAALAFMAIALGPGVA